MRGCQVVLLQELERWNNLVNRMSGSLTDLSRALIGEIGMSDSLEDVGNALFNGFLPAWWRSLAPATQKPLGRCGVRGVWTRTSPAVVRA